MLKLIATILGEIKRNPSLAKTVTPQTDILNGVGIDSLELTEFMLLLEEELNIAIDFERFDLAHLATVQSLMDFLAASGDPPPGGGAI